jgi:hypothetical protein
MIDGKGEARKHRNDDAAFPRSPLLVCPDRPMDDRVANPILHFHITYDVLIPRPENEQTARTSRVDEGRGVMGPCGNEQDSRGDEKLILDVHEMF